MTALLDNFMQLTQRGGYVMWPLLLLSLVGLTLILERAWFFIRTNHMGQLNRLERLMDMLRHGQRETAMTVARMDGSIYGDTLRNLLSGPLNETIATEVVESQRRRLERFLPTLSTIITAAPMLGILGTVLGIIASFDILADQTQTTDPRAVSGGIAEALITTAVGLVIALVILFPYNALRAQAERTLSRIEMLTAVTMNSDSRKAQPQGEQSQQTPTPAAK